MVEGNSPQIVAGSKLNGYEVCVPAPMFKCNSPETVGGEQI